MNKQYLDKDRIKELKDYLNSVLPTKVRATLLQIKLRTGMEFYDTKLMRRQYWELVVNEVVNLNNQTTLDFKNEMTKGNFGVPGAGSIVLNYINTHYKNEWEVINTWDPTKIDYELNYINGFRRRNNIDSILLQNIVECQSIDEFVSQYEKKNVDPELLKRTETIKKSIDIFYKDITYNSSEYMILMNSVNEYLVNRDEQVLHNLLNKE